MKIVINDQPGGFGLSNLALAKALSYGLKTGTFLTEEAITRFEAKYHGNFRWFPIIGVPDYYQIGCYVKDLNGNTYCDREIPRSDPALVKTVEELGDKANGEAAKLKIVEISDSLGWHIESWNGKETIQGV